MSRVPFRKCQCQFKMLIFGPCLLCTYTLYEWFSRWKEIPPWESLLGINKKKQIFIIHFPSECGIFESSKIWKRHTIVLLSSRSHQPSFQQRSSHQNWLCESSFWLQFPYLVENQNSFFHPCPRAGRPPFRQGINSPQQTYPSHISTPLQQLFQCFSTTTALIVKKVSFSHHEFQIIHGRNLEFGFLGSPYATPLHSLSFFDFLSTTTASTPFISNSWCKT